MAEPMLLSTVEDSLVQGLPDLPVLGTGEVLQDVLAILDEDGLGLVAVSPLLHTDSTQAAEPLADSDEDSLGLTGVSPEILTYAVSLVKNLLGNLLGGLFTTDYPTNSGPTTGKPLVRGDEYPEGVV